MGKRKGRRRPTRKEKIAAAEKATTRQPRVVAVGRKKKGAAEIIAADFHHLSTIMRGIMGDIARQRAVS